MKHQSLLLFSGVCALLTAGCVKEPGSNRTPAGNDDYFDFKIDQQVALSVDYGFPNKDYAVLFELYDQNPLTANEAGESVKRDIEPIYRGTTDGSGRFSADIQALSSLSKVWLYSDYPGVLSPVELEIRDDRVSFSQKDYIEQLRAQGTRAVTGNKHTYPDEWLTLGDWDQYGTPDYLEPERTMPSTGTLYGINEVFVKRTDVRKLKERYPEFFEAGLSSDLRIVKPTKIYLVFINSTAVWRNTVGYYTYATGQEPASVDELQRVLVYPDASPYVKSAGGKVSRGALAGGDRVQLKYWDGEKFNDEFPAGVSIGWWLEGMGFDAASGNISIQNKGRFGRFSTEGLNSDGERRTVALLDPQSKKIVAIGFEDNTDLRYNDATFYLEVEEDGAVDGNIPELPDDGKGPSDEENYVKTDGFLMFEDLWPYTGDYDMNDVMVKYSSKVYKNVLNNAVYKIETEYTPCHNGGQIQSGFGIQLTGLAPELVHKVTVDGASPSNYMQGQPLEPGQRYPTVLLFDDIEPVLGKTITVTFELNDATESTVAPPFNPFIFTDSDKIRGKEVHLVKQMPTDKADPNLFGTGHDVSRPGDNLYYVLVKEGKQYPFALNMSFMTDFPIPQEGKHIDDSYPRFRSWMESDGKNDKDWYLHPAK